MWARATFLLIFGTFANGVQSAQEDELCPRQEAPAGVLLLTLGSDVVLGCRGSVTVDGVPLASASVTNNKHRSKQRQDITVRWASQRDATTVTYRKTDSGTYAIAKGSTAVTSGPSITKQKEQSTSKRVLRAVNQTAGQEGDGFGFFMGADPDQDDYEDYDYEVEGSRVTRGIKKRTHWTLNGRQVRAGVETGGILRRPHLSVADSGNYSCYRGDRLISTLKISVGVPPERPTVWCHKKFHTSKVRCDWTSKLPVTPRPLCHLLLIRGLFGNITRVPCSFSRSRCWCAFPMEEGDRALHVANLCVSNAAGSAMSPALSFKLHNIIKPDPPTRVMVRAVEGRNHMLKVSWSYPSSWKLGFYALHFQLRYRPQFAQQYQTVMIEDERMDMHLSCMIYDALPHTLYEVQLQAKDEYDGLWSDWTDAVFAVTWSAPETTTTSESVILEPFEMFPDGSGGSGEDPGVVSAVIVEAEDVEYVAVWLYMSCVFGLCLFIALAMLTVYFLRNRLQVTSKIGKQASPFTFLFRSSRPFPDSVASEQLLEEGRSLVSPPNHSQKHFLPVRQEQQGIHVQNMDYFLSQATEGVHG